MQLEPERLVKILEVLRELPVPNYRCVGLLPTQSPDSSHSPGSLSTWGLDLSPLFQLPGPSPTPALGVPCVTPAP